MDFSRDYQQMIDYICFFGAILLSRRNLIPARHVVSPVGPAPDFHGIEQRAHQCPTTLGGW
jgi:hypothetical protein